MAINSYEMQFTDGVAARQFVIQPYTRNGPSTPTGGVDPSATSANTTLFLYGKGTPDYGERIQENLIFMLEHFFGSTEPSFPIPGQIWFNSSVTPAQLYVYNPKKYTVVSSSGSSIVIQSTNALDSAADVLARFNSLWLTSKSFTFYSSTYTPIPVTQTAAPQLGIVPNTVVLVVTPTPTPVTLAGYTTGGWEDVFQSNVVNTLRTSFDANGQFIQNIPTPVLPGDAANKDYVDTAISGGTLTLSNLGDVQFATPGSPQTNSFLFFDGTYWTDSPYTAPSFPLVKKSGDTMTGLLILSADPIAALGAATKQYVDNQPLSSQSVTITAPSNFHLLSYDSGTFQWVNRSPTAAGVLPLSGGTLTGALSMGGNALVQVPTPVAGTDAANKAYVDSLVASGGTVSSLTYNSTTGELTLNQTSSPSVIIASGFLPAPGGVVSSSIVSYTPPDPSEYPHQDLFFQDSLATLGIGSPDNIEDPTEVRVSAALRAVDVTFGRLTQPRQRLVMQGDGTSAVFNLETGSPNTGMIVGGQPQQQYIVGKSGLGVYINGVKQLAAERGFFKMTGINTTTNYTGATFVGSTITLPGVNVADVLRPGTVITVSGTSTSNDGSYSVVVSTNAGADTTLIVTENYFVRNPGSLPFVASGAGTVTFGPFGVQPGMQTGYVYGGGTNVRTLEISVNGMSGTLLNIDVDLVDCSNFGLMAAVVSRAAGRHYINPIVGATSGALGNFVVSGDRVAEFPLGESFDVRYSTNNNGTYTAGSATYNAVTDETTIPVTTSVPSGTVDGIIFKDNWGYTMSVENGTIVFYSNVAGLNSSISLLGGTLLTGITGGNWPITISSLSGTANTFAPQDWGYTEVGLYGYPSSIVEFTTPPAGPSGDTIEFISDNEIYFDAFNPTANAVTAG